MTYEAKSSLPQRWIQSSLQPWPELLRRETGPDTPNYLQEQHVENTGQENRTKPSWSTTSAFVIIRVGGKPRLLYTKLNVTRPNQEHKEKNRYPKGTCVGYKLICINGHEPTTIVWDTTGTPQKNYVSQTKLFVMNEVSLSVLFRLYLP